MIATCLRLRYVGLCRLVTLSVFVTSWRQIAGLANIASNYLIAGQEASRYGTAHPSVVPYQVFPCKEGFLMIGVGNNKQVSCSSHEGQFLTA